ncbi:GSCOCG00008914001-RA-CDS [Cotesia congregata]|nr:GSCOCG00008914001-RA-CDS [Cotesia congregata]
MIRRTDGSGVLGCLTLRVVKVSRYGNYSVAHGLTKVCFCCFLHFY